MYSTIFTQGVFLKRLCLKYDFPKFQMYKKGNWIIKTKCNNAFSRCLENQKTLDSIYQTI